MHKTLGSLRMGGDGPRGGLLEAGGPHPVAHRPWSLGRSQGGVRFAGAPDRSSTRRSTSTSAGSRQRSSSLTSRTSGMGPPRRCRRAAGRTRPSKCSIVPKTRWASDRGAPGHRISMRSGGVRNSANRVARSATSAGESVSADDHNSSSPYHHMTRPNDRGEVITYLTTTASSHGETPWRTRQRQGACCPLPLPRYSGEGVLRQGPRRAPDFSAGPTEAGGWTCTT